MRLQLPARALPRQGPDACAALSALPPSAEAKRKIASVAVDGCGFMSHPVEEQYVCTADLAGDDSFFVLFSSSIHSCSFFSLAVATLATARNGSGDVL